VFGAAYTLWMCKRVVFGEVLGEGVAALKEATPREIVFLAALALPVLVMGVWPKPFLDVLHAPVAHLLEQVSVSKL
jgi:NADH-quinone oxidoreductase subunit M